MQLKEFISETLKAIIDATSELQKEYDAKGVTINPPTSHNGGALVHEDSGSDTFRRVETVEFDVAVSASTETGGSGKAGVTVFGVEVGADGKRGKRNEQVSRIRFSIPIALAESDLAKRNKKVRDEADRKAEQLSQAHTRNVL